MASKKNSKATSVAVPKPMSEDGTLILSFRQRDNGIKPWRKREIVCTSVLDATKAYQEARDVSGLGVSCFEQGKLSTGHTISYNGRVWLGKDLVMEADGSEPKPEADVVAPEVVADAPSAPVEPAVEPAPKKRKANNQEKVRAAVTRPKAAKVVKAKADKATKGTAKPTTVHARTSLAGIAEAYVAHLTATKSPATASSYRGDLQVAIKHFGGETVCSALTSKRVLAYFDSDLVTKKRSGKAKSPISINKTRRVLRLALEWAGGEGIIEAVPNMECEAAQ